MPLAPGAAASATTTIEARSSSRTPIGCVPATRLADRRMESCSHNRTTTGVRHRPRPGLLHRVSPAMRAEVLRCRASWTYELRRLDRPGEPDHRLGGPYAARAWRAGLPLRGGQEVRRRRGRAPGGAH